MKYLLIICADGPSAPEEMAVMQRECPSWVEEMDDRGVRLLGRELEPPQATATVRVRGGEALVGVDSIQCRDEGVLASPERGETKTKIVEGRSKHRIEATIGDGNFS